MAPQETCRVSHYVYNDRYGKCIFLVLRYVPDRTDFSSMHTGSIPPSGSRSLDAHRLSTSVDESNERFVHG